MNDYFEMLKPESKKPTVKHRNQAYRYKSSHHKKLFERIVSP